MTLILIGDMAEEVEALNHRQMMRSKKRRRPAVPVTSEPLPKAV
jgi:hypothetical protein